MSNDLSKWQTPGVRRLLAVLLLFFVSTCHALTDPTRPAQYSPPIKRVSYQLESILFSEQRRVAVINGQVLAEGEKIGNAKVTSIDATSVNLRTGEKNLRLTLQKPTIRQE